MATMNRSDVIDTFRGVPLFRNLSKNDLNEIAKSAKQVSHSAGTMLAEEGKMGREFFVLLDGKAIVRRKGRKLRTITLGDYFGEISLINPGSRTATVVAETDVKVLAIDSRSFHNLLRNVPGLSTKMLVALCKYIQTESSTFSDYF
jgi:CRP-like cAMP-binding protein